MPTSSFCLRLLSAASSVGQIALYVRPEYGENSQLKFVLPRALDYGGNQNAHCRGDAYRRSILLLLL